MKPTVILLAAAAGLLTASAARAQAPVITSISPQPVPSNLSATITISGTGFGAATDSVYFPGQDWGFAPDSWGSGWCVVTVPYTWSGKIHLRSGATGLLSNDFLFDMTYAWSGRAWPASGSSFTWYLNQNGAPGCVLSDVVTATVEGFQAWECASGFSFGYGGTTSLTGYSHTDGYNVQYWSTTPWADPNLIAVTTTRWNGSNELVETDIHYNGADWTWATDGNVADLDVQNVATHEEGHSVGFLDLYGGTDGNKTMYGITGPGELHARTLDVRDVEGAEYVYPHSGRPNMAPTTPPGWWGPVVAHAAPVTDTNAPLPATLPGNTPQYVSVNEANLGSDCASPQGTLYGYLDKGSAWNQLFNWTGGPFFPGGIRRWINQPVTVRGGRHTYTMYHDFRYEIVESNESDNTYRVQFAWSPLLLSDQSSEIRTAPPDPGFLAVPNCDGFQFTGNWWSGVAIVPQDATDDYDLDLFNDYSGSTQGYQTALATSALTAGYTDFVLVNGNVEGFGATRWAGARYYSSGVPDDMVVYQSNQVGPTLFAPTTYGDVAASDTTIIGSNQLLKIHEIYLPDPDLAYTVTLHNLSGSADLQLEFFDFAASYGNRGSGLAASEAGGPGGDESITYQPSSNGYFGVAVYKNGSADASLSNTYEVLVGPALSNLNAGVTPPNWSSPIVPRNAGDADPMTSVTLPSQFNPPGSTVYLNWSVEQEGPNCSPPMQTQVWRDEDQFVVTQIWPQVTEHCPGPWWGVNNPAYTSDGGRHSVRVLADAADAVAETSEVDNLWVGQWVWPPRVTTKAVPLPRPEPPRLTLLPVPNCDGFSFTHTPGTAWVVGIMPESDLDDYDLYVYDDYSDSQNGFSNLIGRSTLPFGSIDFVVGHYDNAPTTVYPGVLRYTATDGEGYTIDQNDAGGRNGSGTATFSNQVMDAGRVVDVYEAYLSAGTTYGFTLDIQAGPAAELSMFPSDSGGVYDRGHETALAWPVGSQQRYLLYEATQTGYYPIVVWRLEAAHTGTIDYSLSWGPLDPTGVPGEPSPPSKLALRAPSPNPFASATTLAFDLPTASDVRIEIYDIRGQRIAVLADKSYPPGRHQVAWTGRDDRGARVASGLYYARLAAGGRSFVQRMTVLF